MATTFTVIGLGAFGRAAALNLQSLGNTVIGIDINAKMVEEMTDQISHTIIADAASRDTLEEINVAQSQGVLVSIGENFEASLLCVLHLKQLGVTNVWVKANTRAHHAILTDMGVRRVIHPETSMGKRVAQKMNSPFMKDMLSVAKDCSLVALDIPKSEQGLTVGEIMNMDASVRFFGIYRDNMLLTDFEMGTELQAMDRIIIAGSQSNLRVVIKQICGS